MWHKVTPKKGGILDVGVLSVSRQQNQVFFGCKTVRQWGLDQYHSVDLLYEDKVESLAAFQFLKNGEGMVAVRLRVNLNSSRSFGGLAVSCSDLIQKVKAKSGHYQARKDKQGFITVDFGGARREEE